jgi:CRISPR-associated protein (Cas_Cmr5)
VNEFNLDQISDLCPVHNWDGGTKLMDANNPALAAPHQRAAQEAIAEAGRPPFVMKHYMLVARELPRLLQRHGLGQGLAYLQLRSEGKLGSPYSLLARQLDRFLVTTLGVSDRTALAALAHRDSLFYREASELAWLFVRALGEGLEEKR